MNKLLLTLLAMLIAAPSFAQKDKRLSGIEKELKEILEVTHGAGFAVAVVEGDEIVYSKGFGYRDYENKTEADANTLFAIGSSSKAFTSSLLGQLREEGLLSFDDSPIDHVPELRFYNDEMNNQISISDLMAHRTGLPRHDIAWYYFPTHNRDSLIMRIKYHQPFTGVRQQWHYNNFMFLVQGVIAERITGKSWEENIEERLLQPLDMNRSNTKIEGLKEGTNVSFGYTLKEDDVITKTDYYDIAAMSPAGSINSSVNEMANWLKMWINNGQFNGEQILPENYVKEAISSQMIMGGALPDDKFPDIHFANYGYGWMLMSYKGHYRVEHGGNINGFSASVAFYPTDSVGIVVLSNQSGSPIPALVRNTIADRMLEVERTDWTQNYIDRTSGSDDEESAEESQAETEEEEMTDEEEAADEVAHTSPSHNLVEYTGIYENPGYGAFEIVYEDGELYSILTKVRQYIHHIHYDVFEMVDVVDGEVDSSGLGNSLRLKFNMNIAGDISEAELSVEPSVDPIVFKRTPSTIEVDESVLESYVGDYELS